MAVAEDLFDVAIVGGASVGLSCALALQHEGLRVALCDRTILRVEPPNEIWDTRVYAISPAAPHSCMRWVYGRVWMPSVSPRSKPCACSVIELGASLDFSAYELGERALAWIVEHRALQNALVDAARCAAGGGGLSLFAPAQPGALHIGFDHAALTLDDGVQRRTH